MHKTHYEVPVNITEDAVRLSALAEQALHLSR